jgi:MYXO-CTERM domain-containing protein
LNTNNGIQAFAVIPEPTSALLATGVALALAGLRRRYA